MKPPPTTIAALREALPESKGWFVDYYSDQDDKWTGGATVKTLRIAYKHFYVKIVVARKSKAIAAAYAAARAVEGNDGD